MESTLSPSTRPEAINQLINSVERYNPDNVEVLEEYLNAQCESNENDLTANLAVLKLYQFNPHLLNVSALVKILMKALTRFYDADFNLCLCLLSELIVAEEPVAKVIELKQYLEEAQFGNFWTALNSGYFVETLAEMKDYSWSMRQTISHVVSLAYQTIDQALLEDYFNLQGAELAEYLDTLKWSLDTATGVVSIPLNDSNQVEPTVITENVQFAQLTKIIGHSSAL
ncbi:hypothetical protein IWQ60_002799 [Tieghemiomyces parasiticus]|uniref:Eukaryotic translation initiation factor 3 subunit K n=1 Tax=Tieghemiomyces parasiticus TaxID=78921 RepID=A0A9W8AIX1_9FUNG|nr:hypothetical protein IWQ60_002799 [Tieghemiomyces parasiticus]